MSGDHVLIQVLRLGLFVVAAAVLPVSLSPFPKVHALTHPDLEAPLLLAAQLIVQAAQSLAHEERRDRRRCCSGPPQSSTATDSLPDDTPVSSRPLAAATKRKRASAATTTSDDSGDDGVGSAGIATASSSGADAAAKDDQPTGEGCSSPCPKSWGGREAAATREIMEAFPRGWYCDDPSPLARGGGESPAVAAGVVSESWDLLAKGLEAKFDEGEGTAAGGVSAVPVDEEGQGGSTTVAVIDPGRFPLILSHRVYELVVGGLAANLIEVEVRVGRGECVRSALVKVCMYKTCYTSLNEGRSDRWPTHRTSARNKCMFLCFFLCGCFVHPGRA